MYMKSALTLLMMVASATACTRAEFATDDGGTEAGGMDAGDDGQGVAGQGTGGAEEDGSQDIAGEGSGGDHGDGSQGSGGTETGGARAETADVPPSLDIPPDTSCSIDGATASGGNDGSAPSTFHVLRLGDGRAELSSAATPVFIDEHRLDGTLVGTVALPIAATGNNHPLLISGSAASEGALSLSANGQFLTLAGYAALPGSLSISSSSSASAPRVVGRIDALGVVDTSTVVATAFDGNNVRSATSADGTGFWVAGSGGSTGGVWFVAFGTTGGIRVLANPATVRVVDVFGGQLYASSNVGAFADVFTVGNGLPSAGGQIGTSLPGVSATGSPSPFAFVFFDRNTAVAGVDTLYLADDRTSPTGGVQKWVFDGTTWTLGATFSVQQNPVGFRGLTGFASNVGVTLIATTAEASLNRVVVFVDDGCKTPTSTVIATGAPNTILRGVALPPGLR